MTIAPRFAAVAIGMAAMLAACSPTGDASAPETNRAGDAHDAPSTPSIAPVDHPPPAPAGAGTLSATVSGLSGSTSDLAVRVTDLGTVIDLPADALFAYDKSALSPDAEAQLRKAADIVRASPVTGAIQVIGHTDDHGGDAYNQTLSEARARTVADWFRQQPGIRNRAFAVSGKGRSEPIAPNRTADGADDPAGRAKNRRVEVIIPK